MNDAWKNILRYDLKSALAPFVDRPASPENQAAVETVVHGVWTRFIQMALAEVHEVIETETRNAQRRAAVSVSRTGLRRRKR